MIVVTAEINQKIAEDTKFAKDVTHAISRFARMDWGDPFKMNKADWDRNDEAAQSLEDRKGGRVLGVYGEFWIIKDMVATTVLFPHEY
jgi:hypothetical protein